jgi:hypothetical protein
MPAEIRAASFGRLAEVQMPLAADDTVLPRRAATAAVVPAIPEQARITIATEMAKALR